MNTIKQHKSFDVIAVPISTLTRSNSISPSLPLDLTKKILEQKRPNIAEIELTLFENCNIECDFCFHDKKSTIGLTLTEMESKLSTIDNFIKSKVDTVELVQLNIVGGELFQDRWMERLCNDYFNLSLQIKDIATKYGVNLRIVWVSNFLFVKKDTVRELIDKLRDHSIDTHLIVSYDFDGRPMSNNYKKNIEWFGPKYIISVNLVGTTESIKLFMLNTDDYFKWLYNTFNIYFDDYIPDKGQSHLIPSDKLMLSWYKFIADNYPNISPIKELIQNEKNYMHCLSLNKITIFPDNSTSNCRWHRYTQSDFNTKLNMDDNAGMMQRFIDDNDCLSCQYYSRCGMRCFTQWDWKQRERDLAHCPMKMFFSYLEGKDDT